jgi:hypothetical protein
MDISGEHQNGRQARYRQEHRLKQLSRTDVNHDITKTRISAAGEAIAAPGKKGEA